MQVADCICLMSLDKMEAVPVDTHVWQLAVREYHLSGLSNNKTLTDAVYKQIGMRHFCLLLSQDYLLAAGKDTKFCIVVGSVISINGIMTQFLNLKVNGS